MLKSRRFFDRVLLGGTIFMALVSMIILVSAIRGVQDTSRSFRGNLTFYASQVEYEAMQLLDHISRFEDSDPGVTQDDVAIRFDVLWSRVFIPAESELLRDGSNVIPETTQTIEAAQALLIKFEPLIMNLAAQDAATLATIKQDLRSFVPIAHRHALAAKDNRNLNDVANLNNQLRQAFMVFALVVGTSLFSVLSIILLRIDRRQIRGMNIRLEDRVRKRTADLQSANARLAAEIAERRRNQATAAEREARLAQAAQLAKLGYYIWDAIEDNCEYCSDQHAAAHGMTPEEFIANAQPSVRALGVIHPDDREKYNVHAKMLRAGNIIELDYRVITPSGVRRIREVARPIFNAAGQVVREVGSSLDVTDQYETEMKLYEAQRMDSIGKMTGGVAHDFNNLLAVILGNLELIQEVPDSEERDEMIADAVQATLRGRDLTMNMLSFARRAPLDPKELNLNTVVSEMEGMLRRILPENISFKVALPEDIWAVMADRSLTESAILNLVINARDAMNTGGNLTIETSNLIVPDDSLADGVDGVEPGVYVMMAITDTGGGIEDDVLANIFEPFFTTKAIANNSGLGLSMVQGFMLQTGGAIRVYSEPGTGTTFKLFFKSASANAIASTPTLHPDPVVSDPNINVLLVEDDHTVRKVLSRQLMRCGVHVVSASESASAERAFKLEGPFDVVVSDIVMPGDLQGPALVRKLRETDPDLPAVFLSGYPQEALVHGNGVGVDDQMLMKPIVREELLKAIDRAVSKKALPRKTP